MGLTAKEQAQLAKLQAKAAEPEPKPVVSEPSKAEAAQAFLVEAGLKPVSANPYSRIGCAYGACDQVFLPNGSGSWHHTKCPVASQLWGLFQAARKADDDAAYERVMAIAKDLAAKLAK